MEGLLDFVLRDVLTRVGGVDRCVSEFIRVSGSILPDRVFLGYMPELLNGSKTLAGVPVRAQLLGSDPDYMAANAANLARLNPEASSRMATRLLEASDRQYWQPDPETLAALQQAALDLEDRMEGIAAE